MKHTLRRLLSTTSSIKDRHNAKPPIATPPSSLNLASTLAQDELILVVDDQDQPMRSASRLEMRQNNLWHRSTSIFTINEEQKFIVQKRSMNKDYCPGFIDLAAGGVVAFQDTDIDLSAARELEEELGITAPNPQYLFKFKYEDSNTRCWNYVYYQIWLGKVIPQESEIEALFYWDEGKIREMIERGAKIAPDVVQAYQLFLPRWHGVVRGLGKKK
ncbi:hypothetical protein FGO68_gene2666 [Halteria grandinella]|uniref:Nudix hydrolase domain-containing protein n=1 Tax=Halteria grandinella TaxID=5974 RepID=A0A8J8SW69_HALGN|nr:hypothetical protein FGO68_gene2666 [Halteria grandinella]